MNLQNCFKVCCWVIILLCCWEVVCCYEVYAVESARIISARGEIGKISEKGENIDSNSNQFTRLSPGEQIETGSGAVLIQYNRPENCFVTLGPGQTHKVKTELNENECTIIEGPSSESKASESKARCESDVNGMTVCTKSGALTVIGKVDKFLRDNGMRRGAIEITGRPSRTSQLSINEKYVQLGGSSGFLGASETEELVTPDGIGHFRHYQGGSIYWSPQTGAYEVHGKIREKYASLGWERSFLGYPVTDETPTPDGVGRFNHFQGGSIYWTPQTGAQEVHGAIRVKWASLGWERSFLGYPVTDETPTPDGVGRFNHFQGGSIYWTPQTGAQEVHGAILVKWASLGWERSFVGYPVTDETPTPDGVGRFNHFQGASIYWTPQTGAQEVHGAIRVKWAELGWERSFLGYPITDELDAPDGKGRFNNFQGGSIYWNPQTGVQVRQK
jgi:uncharacterized protein with LGFP repeats